MNKIYLGLGVILMAGLAGCSSAAGTAAGNGPGPRGAGGTSAEIGTGTGSGEAPFGASAAGGSTAAPPAGLPSETGQTLSFLPPSAGARYVYVANPERDTVSIIDSTTLAITEVTTGDTPTYLATVPGQDVALVLNVGSHTLSVLRATTMDNNPIAVVPNANTISISPDGLHAVAWFDASQTSTSTTQTNSITQTGSNQDVSVIALSSAGDTSISMTVGYLPSAVVFSSDGAAAFVVTGDGISSLRFANVTEPAIAPLTRIDNPAATLVSADAGVSVDAGVPQDAESSVDGGSSSDSGASSIPTTVPAGTDEPTDVSVTPDGHYAIARRDGTSELLLVDLSANVVTSLKLSSPVTDLKMSPSGTQAYAVLRAESKLVELDIPAGFTDSTHRTTWQLANETVGSVTISAGGKYAVLYTTAVPIKSLVILDLEASASSTPQLVELQKAIAAVAISPDETTALVLHTKDAGSPTETGLDPDTQLDRSYGYSLVRLADGFAKLQITPANPNPFAITPLSEYIFVLLRDDTAGVRIAERISLTSFLANDFSLGSPPTSIAALSSAIHKVFVGQDYSDGRISFIDWVTGDVDTVTGFALNGGIQQ